MKVLSTLECVCTPGPVVCGSCGGTFGVTNDRGIPRVFSRMVAENVAWLEEIDSEGRLNSTLGTLRVLDRQYKSGVPISVAVTQAIKEIGSELSNAKGEIIGDIVERFGQLQTQNQAETTELREIIREIVGQQTQEVVNQVRLLQEQGKSVAEIHSLLSGTVGTLQTVLTTLQLPGVKGETGEAISIRSLQEAFFGVPGIKVEPAGGSGATDALMKFYSNEVEVGRALIEVKARKTWSNSFLEQVRADMQRYNSSMAVIVSESLPRNAKGKGFVVDSQSGLIVVTTQDLLVATVSMFYEIHILTFKIQKKKLDFNCILENDDLIHYVNDNMNSLKECKQIIDTVRDSGNKIEKLVSAISDRLQMNNSKISEILSLLPTHPEV